MADENSERRRWFQFRLRTLLVAVLVLSLPLSWFAVRLERARKQRMIVKMIEERGGEALYEYFFDPAGCKEPPLGLGKLLGEDFFWEIHAINGRDSDISDADLMQIGELTCLQGLRLAGTTVTDDGLERLCHLTKLRYLDIGGTVVTDAGVKHLKTLRDLRVLNLSRTQVTDAGLPHLTSLPLETLSVGWTQVTDAGLEYIGRMSSVQSLTLGGNEVSDAGLEHLDALDGL